MRDGWKELVELGAEDLTVLVEPFCRPVIQGGITIRSDQRIGQQVLHHSIVGAITIEGVDPAVLLFDFLIVHILSRRAHGIANQSAQQRTEGFIVKNRIVVHGVYQMGEL